ncbi:MULTISPECIES: oligoendopeptidase F [Staphylococcus]|uniref:Oligopeptidase F n=9 Tax=Staphylococcus aureus TaxID=1280 RepID=A0AAE8PA58_STAAU|nr:MULTISPECIES: oligoendopeptidase F [Staphylococcus]ETO54680.1 oligoendopeptidase F [Staphylococcus aureus MUM270]HDH6200372.1 oligoendopeptidase F [Staphylococcus aureus LTCF-15-62]HDH6209776.1 oligoendopeptidase F [Staphylococcus aureus LTCF-14-59]HDH6281604.1 oligoendopeptidase F [Staphylococcus aureus LTCF-3-23]HDH6492998.1 oligoendopeptidase F [Staphylococcus aureus MRSA-Lux-7]HDK8312285.1 oligoendopeptidase F [Staphylococcus aureus subsp. aureus ST22]
MSQGLLLREDVPVSETWDLVDLFKDDQQYYESIDALVQQANQFHHTYATTLNSIEQINTALAELENILIALDRLSNYAELRLSVDTSNIEAQVLSAKLSTTYGKIVSQLSFVESEILELPEEILQQLEESCPYQHYIKQLIKQKPFQLSASVEQVLATLSPTLNSPYDLYGTTKMLDITFDSFEHDGTTYPVDYATFENDYEDNKDPEFRRKSFKSFSDGIRKYQHTTAATYNMQVQQEKIEADLRGFESVIDYLLHSQEVTRDMFDRQIDMIMRDLAPVMQKYAKLLQRIHELDNMRFEDLKISVDPDYEPEISIEDSKNYIFGALSVLGDDYTNMLREAYDQRWIDFAQNKGKDTGAFCASPYFTHSYVFISWTGKMAEAFVLAHELGHAGHFTSAQKHQPYLESEASMYFVEAPSTMNEMLMANYLFNTSDNPRFKRWVIGSILSRTYYHNMVTHLLEAAYQREVYHKVDQGESLNAPTLNEIMLNVYKQFFGDVVDMTEGAELTWMRQPHYYMGLYSYTYSAGLTIGTVVSQKIKNEGQQAVDAWLETLKKGGSVSPVELANIAGVDITTEQPLKSTIQYISDLVDEVEKLTDEIEQANN